MSFRLSSLAIIYLPILAIGKPVCIISTEACTADFASLNEDTALIIFKVI